MKQSSPDNKLTQHRYKECLFIWSISKWHNIKSTFRAFLDIYREEIIKKKCNENIYKYIKNIHNIIIAVTQRTRNKTSRTFCSTV